MDIKKKIKFYILGANKKEIFFCINEIKLFAKKAGVILSGPIPFKKKKITIPCRKSVDGEGSETWEHWQLKIYKFLFIFDQNKTFFETLISYSFPKTISLKLIF